MTAEEIEKWSKILNYRRLDVMLDTESHELILENIRLRPTDSFYENDEDRANEVRALFDEINRFNTELLMLRNFAWSLIANIKDIGASLEGYYDRAEKRRL